MELRPSNAKRWMNCPGQPRVTAGMRSKADVHGMTGSIAHDLAHICLIRREDPEAYLGYWGWYNQKEATGIQMEKPVGPELELVIPIDQDMVTNVRLYTDYVKGLKEQGADLAWFEHKMDAAWAAGYPLPGTADAYIGRVMDILRIVDLKYGMNIIYPDDPQVLIYALAALGEGNPYGYERVEISIVQPRTYDPIRVMEYPVKDLLDWKNSVLRPAVERCKDPDAPLVHGKWCPYCPLETSCPAHTQAIMDQAPRDLITIAPDNVPEISAPVDPVLLTGDQLDRIIAFDELYSKWAEKVRSEAFHRLKNGSPDAPKTRKLVQGKASRSWAYGDEDILANLAPYLTRSEVTKTTILSPAQVETLFKSKHMAPNAVAALVKTSHGVSMVHISNKKAALPPTAESDFANINLEGVM